MPTNEMALAKAFRDAGIEQDKAEHLAETIFDAIRDNVATKADLRELEQRLDLKFSQVDLKFEKLERRLAIGGIGALVTSIGVLFAALHYWPPHMTP